MTVSTCGEETQTITSISVYSGSCNGTNSLVCEVISDYDYSCVQERVAASATWFALDGIEYLIQVFSQDGFGGGIELKVTEHSELNNYFCQTALEVTIGGDETIGFLRYGYTDTGNFVEPNFCGYRFETKGAWYSIIGDGGVVSAFLCSSTSSSDWLLSIFKGSCGDLECIGWDSSVFEGALDCIDSLRWRTGVGETYYILVQGMGPSSIQLSREFSLSISSVEVPENDMCVNAETIDLSSRFQVSSATHLASQDQSIGRASIGDICDTISMGGDLWYRVFGTGSILHASTCNPQTNFDSQISVYASHSSTSECDELECVASNDDIDVCESNPRASNISWFAEEGVLYMIQIHGFGRSAGEFVLTVESDDP